MPRRSTYLLVGVMASGTLCAGCAGISPSQMGQTVGTIAGSAIAPGVGAPLGALVGLLAGLLVQGEVDKVTEKRERKVLSEELATGAGPMPPAEASMPPQGEPVRVWVDETVHDGRLIAGHFATLPVSDTGGI
ncbi:MAG: hypothetical protein HYT90_04505 [Candidatus Omnitrophica bacterium]|nr:hypothetical protein [Candidatus Omnitrophota bacterium]